MTLDELFRDAANGCSVPNCNHKHGEMHLHASCHPNAHTSVSVDVAKGIMRIACATCDTTIVAIKHTMSN